MFICKIHSLQSDEAIFRGICDTNVNTISVINDAENDARPQFKYLTAIFNLFK